MATKSNKKNPFIKELFSKKYKSKVVKPKKERVVLKEIKIKLKILFNVYVKTNYNTILITFIFRNFVW